jgi:hypothetical protein
MLFSMFGNKDKELPFPWTCRKPHPVDQGSLEQSGGSIPSRNSCQTFDDFRSVPDLSTLQQQCEALGCISFQLPRPLANAGAILQHAVGAMDTLIRLQSPLIFKVGFSTEGHFAYISANLPISFKICKFSFSHDFYPFFQSK